MTRGGRTCVGGADLAPGSAVLAVGDPVEAGLLAKIAATLEAIEQYRLWIQDKLQEQVYDRLHAYAFPGWCSIPFERPRRRSWTCAMSCRTSLATGPSHRARASSATSC